jgi:hypothetical protein
VSTRHLEILAHGGIPGPAPFIAIGLFLAGIGAAFGAYWFSTHPPKVPRRAPAIGLGVVAGVCFILATLAPVFVGARPSLGRPSTTGSLEFVSPRQDQVFHGDPTSILVELRLDGATVVPTSSLRLEPNEGHIHLALDGSLVSMTTGLEARMSASPGSHELQAEFVAIDHQPFDPRVIATVTFVVQG